MRHSIGVLFIDGTAFPDNKDFSLYVDADGTVHELHGWGSRGASAPEVYPNPPSSTNFHTVYVAHFDPDGPVPATLRAILAEHLARYRECLVWVWPRPSPMAAWVDGRSAGADETEAAAAGGDDMDDLWATEGSDDLERVS